MKSKDIRSITVASELKKIFDKINEDCRLSEESVVPYSDTDYYANQIQLIYGYNNQLSLRLAIQLSEI